MTDNRVLLIVLFIFASLLGLQTFVLQPQKDAWIKQCIDSGGTPQEVADEGFVIHKTTYRCVK